MPRRLVLACTLFAVVVPVAAQHLSPDWIGCVNEGRALSADAWISACTSVLKSDRATTANRAIAYRNRGIAYQLKGDNDRAIADFGEAIRLDPKC